MRKRAYVETLVNDYGDEWLRTVPDNTPLDNLRGLGNCTDKSGQLPPDSGEAKGSIKREAMSSPSPVEAT